MTPAVGPQAGEEGCVDKAAGLVGQGTGEHKEVGGGEKGRQAVPPMPAVDIGAIATSRARIALDPHAERPCPRGDGAADAADAEQAERAPVEFAVRGRSGGRSGPAARAERIGDARQPDVPFEQRGHHVFGDGDVVRGDIADNAGRRNPREIERVVARGRHLQQAKRRQRDAAGKASRHQNLGVGIGRPDRFDAGVAREGEETQAAAETVSERADAALVIGLIGARHIVKDDERRGGGKAFG